MFDLYSDFNILAAVTRLESELPSLLGEARPELELQVYADLNALRRSQKNKDQEELVERLIDAMNQSPRARARLNAELKLQEVVRQDLQDDLLPIAAQLGTNAAQLKASLAATSYTVRWSVDPEDVPKIVEMETRGITIKPGGVGGARSIKFRNLNLDFGEMSSIAAGASLAGYEVLKEPNGLLIAAGVLMIISALFKAATTQIDEQDASVYWGFIQTRGKDNTATETAIIKATNYERRKYKRQLLAKHDVQRSLINLEAIKSIARVAGQPSDWKLIERFTIKA